MDVLTKSEFKINWEQFLHKMKKDSIFIHPTDTIYGLGCVAHNDEKVKKIREMKERYNRPFSIIAPSKNWIFENCVVSEKDSEFIEKLPGPYTLILNLKNKEAVAPSVNYNSETIGVRMPNHWFTEYVERLGHPVITTSANKMGKDFMTALEDLDSGLKRNVDFLVYEGEKRGRPSKVIDLTQEDVEVIHR